MLKFRNVSIATAVILTGLVIAEMLVNIPTYLFIGLLIIYAMLVAYGSAVMSAGMFGTAITKGDLSHRRIALTFDDGPIPGKTDKVLQILDQYNVKAAFFCIGSRVEKSPDLFQAIVNRGHLIGNHSYWHKPWFGLLPATKVTAELAATNAAVYKLIGNVPVFFRPPFGVTNPMIYKAAQTDNFITVGWSIRSFDTIISDPKVLLERITSRLRNGDIVLFHDYSESMAKILPDFIAFAHHNGYEIVRLDALLNKNPYR